MVDEWSKLIYGEYGLDDFSFTPIFRSRLKKGFYHFDIIMGRSDLTSYIVGYVIINLYGYKDHEASLIINAHFSYAHGINGPDLINKATKMAKRIEAMYNYNTTKSDTEK